MIIIERRSRWTGSRGRRTGRARAGTAIPSRRLRPPAVRSRIRPRGVPTRGWRSSRGTTRARARLLRAGWPCWSTSCQGRGGAARAPPATSGSACCGRGRRSSRGPRAASSAWSARSCGPRPRRRQGATTATCRKHGPGRCATSCRARWPARPSRPRASRRSRGSWRRGCLASAPGWMTGRSTAGRPGGTMS